MRRSCSLILIITLLALSVMSCGSGRSSVREKRYVDDGPWWDAVVTDLDMSDLTGVRGCDVLAADGDYCIVLVYTSDQERPTVLRRYDYDGDLCGEIDPGKYTGIEDVSLDNGVAYAVTYGNDDNGSYSNLIYKADFDNGILVNPVVPNIPAATKISSGISMLTRCGYRNVYLFSNSDAYGTEQVIVIDDGVRCVSYSPDPGEDYDSLFVMGMMGVNDKIVYEASVQRDDVSEDYICILDPDTMDTYCELLPDGYYGAQFIPDMGVYFTVEKDVDNAGIVFYDPELKAFTDVMDFADSYVNNEYDNSCNYRVVYGDDDQVVVMAERSGITYGNGTPVLITLTKADSNPNAGKDLLELGFIDEWPYRLYPAINEFNRRSNDGYIVMTAKYQAEYSGTEKMHRIWRISWRRISYQVMRPI
ncbi:hypothetical protein SAMN02910456_00520 [Ruminococcaceae bacterium YRB3002]|nr:hypothetical protein SAMN02910456_00520 [Ruminococcaceae bacterium YRB3002]